MKDPAKHSGTRKTVWGLITATALVIAGVVGFLANVGGARDFVCHVADDTFGGLLGCSVPNYQLACTYVGDTDDPRPCVTLIARNPRRDFTLAGALFEVTEAGPPRQVSGDALLGTAREQVYHTVIRPTDLQVGETFQIDVTTAAEGVGDTVALTFCPMLLGNGVEATVTLRPSFFTAPEQPLDLGTDHRSIRLRLRSVPQRPDAIAPLILTAMSADDVRFVALDEPATLSADNCELVRPN